MTAQEVRWPALGTTVHVLVAGDAQLTRARRAVEAVLADVDAAYSRFRDDSELRRIEKGAAGPVRVSPLLADAVAAALEVAAATGGAVDPTVGRAMRAIGYDRDLAAVLERGDAPIVRLEAVVGWRTVRLDRRRCTLEVPRGVELDLGSSGKAFAADRAAGAALDALGGSAGVLVNLGGDIATAGRAPAAGWRILVSDDARTAPDASGEVIAIADGAVATSSTVIRRWTRAGIETHHIVDPATGLPAHGPWRTATVVAADCVSANAAATAAIVLGERAPGWLGGLGLPARLVSRDGVVVRIGGWPLPVEAPIAAPGSARVAHRPAPSSTEALEIAP